MRFPLLLSCFFLLICGQLVFGNSFRVGAAAVNLEADDSMIIAGGIGPAYAKGQEGRLRAVATVLALNDRRIAIVACDVLFVRKDFVDRALAVIEKQTGIPAANVLVNATHTHHAPSTTHIHGYPPNDLFCQRLERAIADAVIQANSKLADASFHFAMSEERTVGQNSRLLLSDKSIYWVGPMDDAVKPTGPFDPALPVLAFKSPADRFLAILFNHSTHTIGTRKPGVRSPSFYGLAAQELENEFGATVTFLEGASGSTHRLGAPTIDQSILRLKSAITSAIKDAKPHPVSRLRSLKRPFTFKIRTFDEEVEDKKVADYCRKRAPAGADFTIKIFRDMRKQLAPQQGQSRESILQAMVIGDIALVGVPAEYFTSLGLDIKKRSPFANTIVAELANDWIGYLPDKEGHTLGGYQTWMGLHSYAEPGTGERMADEVVKMLNELRDTAP